MFRDEKIEKQLKSIEASIKLNEKLILLKRKIEEVESAKLKGKPREEFSSFAADSTPKPISSDPTTPAQSTTNVQYLRKRNKLIRIEENFDDHPREAVNSREIHVQTPVTNHSHQKSHSGLGVNMKLINNTSNNNTRLRYSGSPHNFKSHPHKQRFTGSSNDFRLDNDPKKLKAHKDHVCINFLRGTCHLGSAECRFLHFTDANRTPICRHFQKNRCKNAMCQYIHSKVNPGAKICQDFVYKGFCEQGIKCKQKHIYECPDWAEFGSCKRYKCKYPHSQSSKYNLKVKKMKNSENPRLEGNQRINESLHEKPETQVKEADSRTSESFIPL